MHNSSHTWIRQDSVMSFLRLHSDNIRAIAINKPNVFSKDCRRSETSGFFVVVVVLQFPWWFLMFIIPVCSQNPPVGREAHTANRGKLISSPSMSLLSCYLVLGKMIGQHQDTNANANAKREETRAKEFSKSLMRWYVYIRNWIHIRPKCKLIYKWVCCFKYISELSLYSSICNTRIGWG